MITKGTHVAQKFLYYRRLYLQWLRDEMKYDDAQIAHSMHMDEMQVRLILMTEVESEGKEK